MSKNELIIQHGNLIGKVLDKQGLAWNDYNLDRLSELVSKEQDPESYLEYLLKR